MKTYFLRRSVLLTVFAASAAFLGACSGSTSNVSVKPATTPSPAATTAPVSSPVAGTVPDDKKAGAEKLVGRWNGPEGTYLTVAEKTGSAAAKDAPKMFSVEIKNLDKAETFDGTAKGDVIEFNRKGKTETVKTATGVETGMKGFEKETNCVVVTKGSEGFCKKQ